LQSPRSFEENGRFLSETPEKEVTGRSWRRIYLTRPILEVIEERA
jgi:hypothetical protein